MGRPKLNPDDKRGARLSFALTGAELRRLDAVLHPSQRTETARGLLMMWVKAQERKLAKGAQWVRE